MTSEALTLPGLDLPAATALGLTGTVTETAALAALAALRGTDTAMRWIIGDLVLAIEADYASEHPDEPAGNWTAHAFQAIAELDIKTRAALAHDIEVARLVPLALRRPELTWAHHVAVLAAGGSEALQSGDTRDRWLDAAVQGRWTVAKLRDSIAQVDADPLPLDAGEPAPPFRLPKPMVQAIGAIWSDRPEPVVLSPDGTVERLSAWQAGQAR